LAASVARVKPGFTRATMAGSGSHPPHPLCSGRSRTADRRNHIDARPHDGRLGGRPGPWRVALRLFVPLTLRRQTGLMVSVLHTNEQQLWRSRHESS
jgi:hypothetical protein